MTALEPTLIPPHAPDCIDRPAIFAALRERFGDQFQEEHVAGIAIFSGYSGGGYDGPVAVVLWNGGPDITTSLILFEGRWLVCEPCQITGKPNDINESVRSFIERCEFEDALRQDEAERFRMEGLL